MGLRLLYGHHFSEENPVRMQSVTPVLAGAQRMNVQSMPAAVLIRGVKRALISKE